MRTKKQIFMLLLALLVGIPTLSAQQSKKEKKEQKKEAAAHGLLHSRAKASA